MTQIGPTYSFSEYLMAPGTTLDRSSAVTFPEENLSLVKKQGKDAWQQLVSQKQLTREMAIAAWDEKAGSRCLPSSHKVKDWPILSRELTAKEIEITETNPSQLTRRLATGEWTSEETLRAFIKRTVIAHYLVNPLTEIFFEAGLERAKALDRHLKATSQPVGPFHGLPISLKDDMSIPGIETTCGYFAWIGNVAQRLDAIVDLLQKGGAVFYCKTNVPQTLMSGECFNYVFGRTVSAWNITTSAGGSSGGEAALVAMGGSPIGVGSDIGGSINTPANFNGIYGLCPSQGRLPLHGLRGQGGNLIIEPVPGPLCRSIDGLEVFVKGVLELEPWGMDASCIRMPWNEAEYTQSLGLNRKLCLAFIPNDGIVTPHPPIQRGMRETKAALEAAGHHVIEMPSFFEAVADGFEVAILKIFNACGSAEIEAIISKYQEPLSTEIVLPTKDDVLSVPEYLAAAKYIVNLRQKYLQKWMQTVDICPTGRPVDAFILPSGGHVAPPHGTMDYLLYEAISNLLDWTCATIPVGFVDPELDNIDAERHFVPLSDLDRRNHEKCELNSLS